MQGRLKRFTTLLIINIIAIVLVMIVVLSKYYFDIGFICPINTFLKLSCPGCGGTRMAVALLKIDFYQAFRYNPFLFVTAPIIAIVYMWQSIVYIKDNRFLKYLDSFLIAYAIALIIFGVIRNLVWFSYLAPTQV